MFLTLLLLLAATFPQQPLDESAAIATVRQAAAKASGASESAQMDIIRKLRAELFGAEVSVNSAVIGGFGNKKVVHPNWLVWGMNDLLMDVKDSETESDYRRLGFVFSGERTDDGAARMLSNQQEVVFEKNDKDLYVSYVVLFSTKDIATLTKGGKVTFTFRVSALRVFSVGFEMRGVATAIRPEAKKTK